MFNKIILHLIFNLKQTKWSLEALKKRGVTENP
jgi:hypothetical protein